MHNLREDILTQAARWEGTRYHHHACLRGIGVDCIGLIIGIAKAVQSLSPEYLPPQYSSEWHLHNTRELLREGILACGGTPVTLPAAQPGDILLFRFGLCASHAAILLAENWMLHAVLGKRVLRQRLTAAWRQKLDSAYAFPGVTSCLGG